MAVFIARLLDGAEETAKRLQSEYPNTEHYKLTDDVYLLHSDEIAEKVAARIGLDGENEDATGEVYKLNGSVSGFTRPGIWDWLDQAYQKSAQ